MYLRCYLLSFTCHLSSNEVVSGCQTVYMSYSQFSSYNLARGRGLLFLNEWMNEYKFNFKIKEGQKWEPRNSHFSCQHHIFQKSCHFCLETSLPYQTCIRFLTIIQRPTNLLKLFNDNKRYNSSSCYFVKIIHIAFFCLHDTSHALNIKRNVYPW